MHQVHIRVDPSIIPNHIDVDVTPLTLGHSLHVGDLKLPAGVTVLDDEELTVCAVSAPRAMSETPAEGVAEIPAEPELIRKPKGEEGGEE
jgi:large subunit ribosomal protein L25